MIMSEEDVVDVEVRFFKRRIGVDISVSWAVMRKIGIDQYDYSSFVLNSD